MDKILLNEWLIGESKIQIFGFINDPARFDVYVNYEIYHTDHNRENCFVFILNALQGFYK